MLSDGMSAYRIKSGIPSCCHSMCNGSIGPSESSPKIRSKSPGKVPTMSMEFVKLN